MTVDLSINVKDALWQFHWDVVESPFVKFTNPKSRCVVKYSLCQLQGILEDLNTDHDFIPVPKYILESALEAHTRDVFKAA